jgi:hypothetical protein
MTNKHFKGKYKVGIVQSISRASLSDIPSLVFTRDIVNFYLDKYVPILSSNDAKEIYEFIRKNERCNNICRYILHINSGIMKNFINYISIKKVESPCARALLKKCIFISTYSNADIIRQLNFEKKTNIYFSLSPISTVLSNIEGIPENKLMLIVSNSDTPYFNQVFNTDITPKFRLKDLTHGKINDFINRGGYKVVLSLATEEEYDNMVSMINASNFDSEINVIELDFPDNLKRILNKNIVVSTMSSGVGISGNKSYYNNLNRYLIYDNVAIVLAQIKNWKNLIKSRVLLFEEEISVNSRENINSKILTFTGSGNSGTNTEKVM